MASIPSIRVLHCIDTLHRGGAETLLLDLCRHAYEHRIELHLIASGGGVLQPEFEDCAIHFVRRDRRHAFDLSLAQFIRDYCAEHEIQVVHGHQVLSTMHALYALRGSTTPVVHSIHGFTEDIKNKVAFRAVVQRTDANILVSQSMINMVLDREWIRDLPQAHVVYNGIDPKRLDADTAVSGIRAELGLGPHETLIGMVGNFYSVKDQLRICKAMALLSASHPELHCAFVGRVDDERPYKACLDVVQANNLRDRVHFLGARTDIGNILRELDCFVFSTVKDTFGLALVEAMMVGTPCMASDIDVMQEISCQGELAELFQCANSADLAQKLEAFLMDPRKRKQMSQRAKDYALKNYSIGAHIHSLRELYIHVLDAEHSQEPSSKVDTSHYTS